MSFVSAHREVGAHFGLFLTLRAWYGYNTRRLLLFALAFELH